MVDLGRVYAQAEKNKYPALGGLMFVLTALLVIQTFLPPLAIPLLIAGVVFLVVSFAKPLWTLSFLAIYLPFEPLFLKFVPDEIYLYARFFSEIFIYILVVVVFWRWMSGKIALRASPIDLPFALFLVVLAASAVINTVDPTAAVLGTRQIIRFILVFFVVYYLKPPTEYIKRLTWVMFAIVVFQAVLGIAQSIIGAPLDEFLLPSAVRTFEDITLTSGVRQFWDPGSRVFATLGRYDRLGGFLYFFLLIGVGVLYEFKLKKHKTELLILFAVGLPALILTFSRGSWFAFLLGFLFIGVLMYRDKRVIVGFLLFATLASSYLGLTGLNVQFMTEAPGQTLVERFYEAFSYSRWRSEYYGLGRLYWTIQTPMVVVPSAPVFGLGPGQYGGGAAAALGNSEAYDRLGLPFGVFGTEGYIDNGWFALWGETGTLGLIFYLWMYGTLFFVALRVYRKSDDPAVRALAIGFAAAMIGIAFNAFLSTLLEIRTSAFYLWLYAGFIAVLAERTGVLFSEE